MRLRLPIMLMGVLLTACNTSAQLHPTVEGPLSLGEGLRIGVLVSENYWQTSTQSNHIINAAYLLRDRVNACGGINKAPMSILIGNADGTSYSEMNALQDLIETHRVHGVVAHFTSATPNEVLKIIDEREIPLFVIGFEDKTELVLSDKESDKESPYRHYVVHSAEQTIRGFAQLILNEGFSSIYLITSDTDTAEVWQKSFVRLFTEEGGVLANDTPPLQWKAFPERQDTSDNEESNHSQEKNKTIIQLQPYLEQILSHQDELSIQNNTEQDDSIKRNVAIATMLNRREGIYLFQMLQGLGWSNEKIPIFWHDLESLEWIIDQIHSDQLNPDITLNTLTGVMGIHSDSVGAGFSLFSDVWQSKLDDGPSSKAAYVWDAVSIMAAAAETSGQNSRSGILQKIYTVSNPPGISITDICQGLEKIQNQELINVEGASGSIDIHSNGKIPGIFNIWRIDVDGRPETVESLSLDNPQQ